MDAGKCYLGEVLVSIEARSKDLSQNRGMTLVNRGGDTNRHR